MKTKSHSSSAQAASFCAVAVVEIAFRVARDREAKARIEDRA
jgi:hypothetical protein